MTDMLTDFLATPFTEFQLLRPYWLLLLLPAALLLWKLLQHNLNSTLWSAVVDTELLKALQTTATGGGHQRLPYLLLFCGWLLAIIALSGPTWERQPTPSWESEAALILLLDLSPSMEQQDLPPSRLERARFKLMDILKQRKEGRTALIIFSEEPYLVTPLTDDVATISNLLSAIDSEILPTQGDYAAPAIQMAIDLLKQGEAKQGELLLLSDGVADIADTLTTAHQLQQMGHRLSLLALKPDEDTPLQSLAKTGGGRYATLTADEADIQHLLPKVERSLQAKKHENSQVEHWVEAGVWLLVPILLLAALGFRRGWSLALLITMLPLAPQSEAVEWEDLWLRADQQGARALSQGDHATAATRFKDQGWRGTTLYQQESYEAAAEAFSQSTDPEAPYNRGNALAKGGKLQEAAEAYQQMLEQQPNHQDALRNLDLVKKLLEQQQQKEQEQEQEKDQQEQQDSDSDSDASQPQPSDQSPDEPSASEEQADKKEEPQQTPQQNSESDNKEEEKPQSTEEAPQPDSKTEQPPQQQEPSPSAEQPRSEAEMETEQWLKQIPEDPSGLLRRKFMLEHLYRQQRNNSR